VGLSNSLEPKFSWLAFPGLIRGVTIIHVMMFVVLAFQPAAIAEFVFDPEKILSGEAWRVGSFLLLPPLRGIGTFTVIFMFIGAMIAFMINDALERTWGVFRTSLYCYGVMFCQIIALTLLSILDMNVNAILSFSAKGGAYFYGSIFLAFATSHPRHEFRIMFIIPVQVWVLGAVMGVIIVLDSFRGVFNALFLYLTFLPYIVWALPRFIRWYRTRSQTAARQADYRAHSLPAGDSFHACEQCGATDTTHPDRDFRIAEDDRELCDVCLEGNPVDRNPAEGTT
jgi:hypothetical protein